MLKFPLEGIRVADFTQVWLGPHMGEWLAVMGAEVIKVESRVRLDFMREANPYVNGEFDPKRRENPNIHHIFASLNLSKKSCTLNLRQPKGVELARKIISISDVVVDNFSPGVMDRMGLGYSALKQIKPDIIVLSASATGSEGPLSDIPGYANVMESWGGEYSITGYQGGPPDSNGNGGWTDLVAAQHGAFAILIALYHRNKTGQGQFIDLAMMDDVACRVPEAIMDYIMNGRVRRNRGNQDDFMAPHNCYPCQGEDKWVAIAVSNQEEWLALCQTMDNPEWCQQDRFADQFSRWQNQEELDRLLGEWTRKYTPYEVMRMLQRAGVAAGPSLDVDEVIKDPHLAERGLLLEVDQPEMVKTWSSLPLKPTPTFRSNYQPAPQLGQHNDYVFGELLGMSKDEIARLVGEKVIF